MWVEFETNSREVNSVFGRYVYHYDMNNKNQTDTANDLAALLRIRFKTNL